MRQLRILPVITKRDSDSVERYLSDIAKVNLLHAEDEVALTMRIHGGDKAALDKLVSANLRFVVSVAKRYQGKGLSLCDLISEGNIGLINAAWRFDPTMGFKFITFAVWWIRQSILAAIAEQRRLIRLPANQVAAIAKITTASIKLEQQLERMPGIEELAAYTGLTEDRVIYYINSGVLPYSLDTKTDERTGTTLMDTVVNSNVSGTDHLTISTSLATDLNRALNTLSGREQKIIMLFYGINGYPQTTLDEMTAIFNLSRERIRQLKDKAHRSLRLNCQAALSDYFRDDIC